MPNNHSPQQNRLLAALPATDYQRLLPHLDHIQIPSGHIIYKPGDPLHHLYFPTTAIMSVFYSTETGAAVETTGVGNEGMIGIAVFMGGRTMPDSAMALCAGHAYRMPTQVLMNELNRPGGSGALHHLLLRYIQVRMTQIAQTAACNRHHSLQQRLCRWLLSSLDRAPSNGLPVTQETIASALGVRREGVTEAAGRYQRAGLICYHRGCITVLDRAGLEKQACECYRVVKKEVNRLLALPGMTAN
ncbi:MAG: Crp/Fnr family transcriptional regulator [Thiohalomonadaceae bacterium]